MGKSRAEYFRKRRAERREKPAAHVCEGCGKTFTPKRSDARYCSAACRAAHWRPITHEAVHHRPGGFRSGSCMHEIGERELCGRPAPWRHDRTRNTERELVLHGFYCDEHIRVHVDLDQVTVGESIHKVMARDGREARARHGTRAGKPKGKTGATSSCR